MSSPKPNMNNSDIEGEFMRLSRVLIIMAVCLPMMGQAKHKKVIGGIDSRIPSNKSGVARVSMSRSLPGGCTATLIGKPV